MEKNLTFKDGFHFALGFFTGGLVFFVIYTILLLILIGIFS